MLPGTIHNLNGIVQALTLQTELIQMMFADAIDLMAEGDDVSHGAKVAKLTSLLAGRAPLVDSMHVRVKAAADILKINSLKAIGDISPKTLAIDRHLLTGIIDEEMAFFMADPFFKHKVGKSIDLDCDFPVFDAAVDTLHYLCSALIDNAITALKAVDSARMKFAICLECHDGILEIIVADTGAGVSSAMEQVMYDPFISGWDEHSGLGLFFVRQLCRQNGWLVNYRRQGDTSFFAIRIPLS